MEYSVIVSWLYFGIYFTMILIASFICALHVRDEYKTAKHDATKNEQDAYEPVATTDANSANKDARTPPKSGCKHHLKKWLQLVWQKKEDLSANHSPSLRSSN
eukprot:885211_1